MRQEFAVEVKVLSFFSVDPFPKAFIYRTPNNKSHVVASFCKNSRKRLKCIHFPKDDAGLV